MISTLWKHISHCLNSYPPYIQSLQITPSQIELELWPCFTHFHKQNGVFWKWVKGSMSPNVCDKTLAHNLYIQTPLDQAQSKFISRYHSAHKVITFFSITGNWSYCNKFNRTSLQWVPRSGSNRRELLWRIKYAKSQQQSTSTMFKGTSWLFSTGKESALSYP